MKTVKYKYSDIQNYNHFINELEMDSKVVEYTEFDKYVEVVYLIKN